MYNLYMKTHIKKLTAPKPRHSLTHGMVKAQRDAAYKIKTSHVAGHKNKNTTNKFERQYNTSKAQDIRYFRDESRTYHSTTSTAKDAARLVAKHQRSKKRK